MHNIHTLYPHYNAPRVWYGCNAVYSMDPDISADWLWSNHNLLSGAYVPNKLDQPYGSNTVSTPQLTTATTLVPPSPPAYHGQQPTAAGNK